jgi:phage-related protein
MEMFLERTAYAAGNYEQENRTFAGSFNTLKAATSNFLSGAGGIEDVADALIGFSNILIESIGKMAPSIVEGLVNLTQTLIPQIPILLDSLLPTILEGAIGIIQGLVVIFPALIKLVTENLPTILNAGITILLELVKGIVQALPELIPTMVKVIMDMVNILLDNIDLIIEAGIQILIALIDGIINALPELVTRLPEIIIKIVATLINLLPEIIAVGIRVIGSLITGIFRAVPELVIRIPELIARMVNGLLEGLKDFANVGVNLVKGLWNGISNSFAWIKNKIKGWVGNVMDFIKGLFGIHSPSTVMRDEVGKYLAQGLGVGFDDELDSVYNDMQRAIDLETGRMSANVQASGTYQMAMSGLPTFNLLDNSEHSTQLVVNGKVLAEVVNTENRNREVSAS